jgi:GcrA cell cycle regulator
MRRLHYDMPRAGSPWTREVKAKLHELWLDGQNLSAAEIGRALGISKNAVVGKVYRMGLPNRESPIKPLNRKNAIT